jgi:hypothetical protein
MGPMLGEFELAAADRGMGDFHHGVWLPIRLQGVLYRAVGVGGKRAGGIADCRLQNE